jgi:hypothetical protein
MDELFRHAFELINQDMALEPLVPPPELQHVKLPLKLFDMRCYNWKAEKVRKIYFVRIKVAVPALDIFGMAIYPEASLDIPSFACDFSCTKKKVFTYINFVPFSSDSSYVTRYIEPMKAVFEKYRHFPRQKTREWMQPYVSPYAIYSMPEKAALEELKRCAMDYLSLYLELFARAEPIGDPSYRDEVEGVQRRYARDLAENDASRKMLGRIIGKEKARRIFQEVIT